MSFKWRKAKTINGPPLHGELTFRICVYWFELFSQVSYVAHGPLLFFFSPIDFIQKRLYQTKILRSPPFHYSRGEVYFFSHKYSQNTFSITYITHTKIFKNSQSQFFKSQPARASLIYICLTLSKAANSIWITIYAYIVSWEWKRTEKIVTLLHCMYLFFINWKFRVT